MPAPGQSSGYFFVDRKELDRSIKDVQKTLRKALGKNISSKMVQDIFMEKAKFFRQAMVREAPFRKNTTYVDGGTLKRSMTIFPGKDDTAVYIGPRRKRAKYGKKGEDGFYGYWVNYGLGNQSKAAKFIQNAYESKGDLVARTIIRDLRKQVKKVNSDLNGTSS